MIFDILEHRVPSEEWDRSSGPCVIGPCVIVHCVPSEEQGGLPGAAVRRGWGPVGPVVRQHPAGGPAGGPVRCQRLADALLRGLRTALEPAGLQVSCAAS